MKRLIIAPLLLIYVLSFGQSDKVIAFVDAYMGKRVGSGICQDLVAMAYGQKENFYVKFYKRNKYQVKKHRVGDAITFDDAVLVWNGREIKIENHIGIIYEIKNDSTMIIAEQNVIKRGSKISYINYHGEKMEIVKDSHVQLSTINLKSLKEGRVAFYRF